jgi:hypothetical protein
VPAIEEHEARRHASNEDHREQHQVEAQEARRDEREHEAHEERRPPIERERYPQRKRGDRHPELGQRREKQEELHDEHHHEHRREEPDLRAQEANAVLPETAQVRREQHAQREVDDPEGEQA